MPELEELLEVEVRQATGQGFRTDEAIDIGDMTDRQAVGGLYIAVSGHRGGASQTLRRRADTRASKGSRSKPNERDFPIPMKPLRVAAAGN